MSNSNVFTKVKYKKPSRSRFDLSYSHKTSFNMGQLIPTMWKEVMPGDVWRCSQISQVRLAPMLAPIMHPVVQYSHTFFVPLRLLWKNWEAFITHDNSTSGMPVHPYVALSGELYGSFPLLGYLGVPSIGTLHSDAGYNISAMPLAAYGLIWNEYYRDQNLQAAIVDPQATLLIDGDNTIALGDFGQLRNRAWMHDYFTSCLPFAQKGVAVNLPVDIQDLKVFANDSSSLYTTLTGTPNNIAVPGTPTDNSNVGAGGLFAQGGSVTSSTINDLRSAWTLQRWLEKNARAGTRYTELLKMHYNVRPEDFRLQRPEYVYGSQSPIIVSEVLNTTGSFNGADPTQPTSPPQGNMSGHGNSINASRPGVYKAKEHGILMTITSVLPMTAYQQGLDRTWLKTDQFSYPWPDFANLGEQEVLNSEIFADRTPTDAAGTFGYQSRYAEYKYSPSIVSGDFKTSLNYWHMGRIFDTPPSLNEAFVVSDPTTRIFAVTDPTVQHLYCQIVNQVSVLRALPYFGTPY